MSYTVLSGPVEIPFSETSGGLATLKVMRFLEREEFRPLGEGDSDLYVLPEGWEAREIHGSHRGMKLINVVDPKGQTRLSITLILANSDHSYTQVYS